MRNRFHTPHGVLVLVPIDPATSPGVRDDERDLTAGYAERRLRTFVTGRVALRLALGSDLAIGRTDRGAPIVPPGWRGSISHTDRWAGGLALRTDDDVTVGLDLESVCESLGDVVSHVLVPSEIAQLVGLDEQARTEAVLERLSLKEAFYKAVDPRLRRFVGFHQVAVQHEADLVRFVTGVFHEHAPAVEGRVWRFGELVISTVLARWS
ncbi:MAG TPA: 4'-phosphopantetheinyl transferase superfamily protein [Egibacteraceae bacterium]|nr:4'-phosphopantetheinyl transferase superfamily protein [Egibacteraceae bacterium]